MKKQFLICAVVLIVAISTVCLVGCKTDTPTYQYARLDLYSLEDLNHCLGYGVLLPENDMDKITVDVVHPYFSGDVEDNIHVIDIEIEKVNMICDDYDLHIKIIMTLNKSENDEILLEDGFEKVTLGGEKVIKQIVKENVVKYKFIDRKFHYEIDCDFKDTERVDNNTPNVNNKTFEENVASIESFIAKLKRYPFV